MIGAATTIMYIPAAVRREVAQCQNLVHEVCGSGNSITRDRGAVLEIVFGATVPAVQLSPRVYHVYRVYRVYIPGVFRGISWVSCIQYTWGLEQY